MKNDADGRNNGNPLELTGPPHRLSGIIAHSVQERRIPVALKLERELTIVDAHARALGANTAELRLKLPRDTAAGAYRGEAVIGGTKRTLVIRVQPVVDLRVEPKQTRLETSARAKTEFTVEVTNRGNSVVDIAKSYTFDLDDAAGQDRALGRALRARLSGEESRVDRFFEELRADHGGQARVLVLSGAGALRPASARTLRCSLDVPDDVRAGTTYTGAWKLENVAHVIVVTVSGAATPRVKESAKS